MKKLLTLTICLLTVLCLLTGCGTESISFQGTYWLSNETLPFGAINEKCTYEVKCVSSSPSNSAELKNNAVSLEITNGEYVTLLTSSYGGEYGNHYEYVTTLDISGKYVINGEEFPFTDHTQTKTLFKPIVDSFAPIYSEKVSTCSSTVSYGNGGYAMQQFKYDYSVSYSGKNAVTKYSICDLNNESKTVSEDITYKKYTKGAYIDNELLLLIPRLFNISSNFYQAFNTIDILSKRNNQMYYSVSAQKSGEPEVKTFSGYSLNGDQTGDISTLKFVTAINETFSGSSIESYYAQNTVGDKHRLIRSYSKINDNIGILEYSLVSVENL